MPGTVVVVSPLISLMKDQVDALVRNGFRLKMLKEEEIDLEDVFMGITKGITN